MSKRVLVTGSSRGIGRATALRLREDGWSVGVHFARDQKAALEVAAMLGGDCFGVFQADLERPDEADRLMEQVGRLDALVNNAGIYTQLDFVGSSDEDCAEAFERTWRVNFESPRRMIRRFCQQVIREERAGTVVNVASRVGHRGEAGASCYSVSKAALINLTRALAVEHAKLGVAHFAIAPGWVETAMARDGMDDRLPQILRDIPLGRMANPEDCAGAIAYFLRDEARYLSGVTLDINGASYLR